MPYDYDDFDPRERFDADELYGDDDTDYVTNDEGEIEECGACGRPATSISHNEPVCSRHTARDVYGV